MRWLPTRLLPEIISPVCSSGLAQNTIPGNNQIMTLRFYAMILTFAPLLGEDRGQSAVTDGRLDADQDITTLAPAIV